MTIATVILIIIVLIVFRASVKKVAKTLEHTVEFTDKNVNKMLAANDAELSNEFDKRIRKALEEKNNRPDDRDFWELYNEFNKKS